MYDSDEIREYVGGEYLVQDGIVILSRKEEITLDKFLGHWRKIIGSVPRWLFRTQRLYEARIRAVYGGGPVYEARTQSSANEASVRA